MIGSFQALQHRAAKMFTELELSARRWKCASAIDNDARNAGTGVLAKAKMGDTPTW